MIIKSLLLRLANCIIQSLSLYYVGCLMVIKRTPNSSLTKYSFSLFYFFFMEVFYISVPSWVPTGTSSSTGIVGSRLFPSFGSAFSRSRESLSSPGKWRRRGYGGLCEKLIVRLLKTYITSIYIFGSKFSCMLQLIARVARKYQVAECL